MDHVTGKTECALVLVIWEYNSFDFGAPVTKCLTIKNQIPTENYNVAFIYDVWWIFNIDLATKLIF